jgi:glyoxylase-like metal-dependent hydrolase (beta-lactamase superfamily II)
MRIKTPGKVTENLWLLGTEESCVYLLRGKESSAVISAGLSYILPEFLHQLSAFGIDKKQILHMIILHSHFDHVGIVPFLKRTSPHLNVYASSRAWQVLSQPKSISVIKDYTLRVATRRLYDMKTMAALDWEWRDDISGQTLSEEKVIDLGNVQIVIYETPGHSSCSISAYVPQMQILFASDAVAIPYRDEYIIAAASNMKQYQQSLDKIINLKVKILAADHYGYIDGEEAALYVERSKQAAFQMEKTLITALRQEGSVEKATDKLVDLHYLLRPDYFIAPEILTGTYSQMLKQYAR